MLNISEKQLQIIKQYLNSDTVDAYVNNNDLSSLLIDFDDAIIEFGMNQQQEITKIGIALQRIYDEIYNQN